MKRCRPLQAALPTISLALSLQSLPSRAEGTWIEVYRRITDYKPGTWGEVFCKQDRICGQVILVDASSIVKRGDFVYYNWALDFINEYGGKTDPNKARKPRGVEANCRNMTVNTPKKGWLSWSEAGIWESSAARFACR